MRIMLTKEWGRILSTFIEVKVWQYLINKKKEIVFEY